MCRLDDDVQRSNDANTMYRVDFGVRNSSNAKDRVSFNASSKDEAIRLAQGISKAFGASDGVLKTFEAIGTDPITHWAGLRHFVTVSNTRAKLLALVQNIEGGIEPCVR